jgi:hypothetical protein
MRFSVINERQVHSFRESLFGDELHAKRVLSLTLASLGVIHVASLQVWEQLRHSRQRSCPDSASQRAPAPGARKLDGEPGRCARTPTACALVLLCGHLNLEGLWAPPSVMSDGGTRGVADAAVEDVPMLRMAPSSEPGGLHLEMPKEPLPGQRRPPCPGYQTNIRGGCWVEVARGTPPCGEGAYDWKGACYYPVFAPPRPNTSDTP